jgi:flagellar basal-body rod protein FlgF/flagellar basal-body rod protein FlgG
MARTDALDTIANNLANSSTSGFRAQRNSFSSVLAGHGQTFNSELNEDTNSYGLLGASRLDLKSGALQPTGNPLDVAIDGTAFLAVQTSTGNTAYTRNGSLQISSKGQLTTASGDLVMGVTGPATAPTTGPITVPRGAVINITSDGTVTADGAVAGKLKLVDFSATANPQSQGGSNYIVPATDVTPATTSQIRQGFVEGSNVNPMSSVIELINAQRDAEGMRHALTMIDTELDKTAAQDLPRVS